MYLAYFDESGDSGSLPMSPTSFFVLACVLVHEAVWLPNLDQLVKLRRRIRRKLGIRVHDEIKATHIKKGRGPLSHLHLAPARRARMLRFLLKFQNTELDLKTFVVAVDKRKLQAARDPREVAWQYSLQRVDTFCRKSGTRAGIFPDAGHSYFIRRLVRQLRRHQLIRGMYGGVILNIRSERIVEDPNERHSQDSFFIQLADWNAYAAHRSQYVDPSAAGFEGAWDELGSSRLAEVNKLRGGPPGIVLYP
jgi:hypothetical protein